MSKTGLTFAQIKALKASQAAAATSPSSVPRSPRSLLTIDARSLSPRPERIAADAQSESELEEELKAIEAEHERVRSKLQNMEQNEAKGKEQLLALRNENSKLGELQKDVKYAELELQFAKERVAKVRQQKHKQELLFRSAGGSGVNSEIKALQDQLSEETARGKSLVAQKELTQEQIYKLEQAIEAEEERTRIASLSLKSANAESEEMAYYRKQLEEAKKKLAQTTEHIAVLTVQLEGEMRANRAHIDEVEADFLRQIAKLNASLTT